MCLQLRDSRWIELRNYICLFIVDCADLEEMNCNPVWHWSIADYLGDMFEQDIMPTQHPRFGQDLNGFNAV
jgi:acetone carboxylase gamma subunit